MKQTTKVLNEAGLGPDARETDARGEPLFPVRQTEQVDQVGLRDLLHRIFNYD